MPEKTEIKKWLIKVSGGVAVTMIIFGLVAVRSHFAKSDETEARSLENEQRNVEQDAKLKPLRDLVEVLSKRMVAEDAAYDERAKLCRQGIVTDIAICRAVDEVVVE